jgi:hypothetical protein
MPRTTKAIRLLFAILAIGFFAAPIAARTLGITAEAFENRRFADPPKLSQGWNGFQQTTQYLTDRMPLRAQAVRANTQIWTDVFGTDPSYTRDSTLAKDQALPFAGAIERDDGEVRIGRDGGGPTTSSTGSGGWLYLQDEFSVACEHPVSAALALRRWGKLMRVVRADGRPAVALIAPHKASVYPEYAPEQSFIDCARKAKADLWQRLARDGPKLGVLGLRNRMLEVKQYAGGGLFQRKDSHWSTLGALVLVDAALDELGDGVELKPSEIVERGSVPYTGDLTVLNGSSQVDRRDEYGIARARGAPRVPGRTVLICDSFGYGWIRLFKPYFEDISYVSWYEPPDVIAAAIRRADRVILEANETVVKFQAVDDQGVETVTRMLADSPIRTAK